MRCIKKTGGVKEMGGFYEGLIGEGDILAVQRTFMGSALNIMKKVEDLMPCQIPRILLKRMTIKSS